MDFYRSTGLWYREASVDDPTARFDELEICFEVAEDGSQDIYCSKRESRDETLAPAVPIDIINSVERETTPRMSADGLLMLFASSRSAGGGKKFNLYQRCEKAFSIHGRNQPWSRT